MKIKYTAIEPHTERLENHPVRLPFLGGSAALERNDKYGERRETPVLRMNAQAVDADWEITVAVPSDFAMGDTYLPGRVKGLDEGFRLVFANGRRFKLLRSRHIPITETEALRRQIANPPKTPRPDPERAAAARVEAMEARTLEDAVNALSGVYGEPPTRAIQSGMMHARGETWAAIMAACRCSKATVSADLDAFYAATGWPRPDRRTGKGKRLSFDDARDQHPPDAV